MRGSAISGTSAGPMPVNRMARLKAVICLEPGTRSCGHCDRGNITFLFILNQDLADLPSIVRYRRPPCTVSARGKHFPTLPCPLPLSSGMGMQEYAHHYQSTQPLSPCTILPQPNARLILSARTFYDVHGDVASCQCGISSNNTI